MIYITGDTHGQFGRIETFCERFGTSREDILIILGDAGINFSGWNRDCVKKRFLESLPVTLFCIHGNHEQRPQTIGSYREKQWHGGTVYYEEEYPNLLFAKDGEVFELDGIEDRMEYQKWYCGHYHTEKKSDKLEIMFENVAEF